MTFTVPPMGMPANGGLSAILLVIAIVSLVLLSQAKSRADTDKQLRSRLQAGLEATIGKLNPNCTPPKTDAAETNSPSEAFVALQSLQSQGVLGKKAKPPRQRKPRTKKTVEAADTASEEAQAAEAAASAVSAQRQEDYFQATCHE